MGVELLPERATVHVMPDAFDGGQQHLILRCPRQHQMEHLVVVLAVIVGGDRPLLLLDDAAQVIDVRPGRHLRSKGGNVTLKQLARLQNLERADVAVKEALFLVLMLFRNAHHVDAGTLANIHGAL